MDSELQLKIETTGKEYEKGPAYCCVRAAEDRLMHRASGWCNLLCYAL